jgi:hypothetical protein
LKFWNNHNGSVMFLLAIEMWRDIIYIDQYI